MFPEDLMVAELQEAEQEFQVFVEVVVVLDGGS